jgi:excisionase family DNA binding protein
MPPENKRMLDRLNGEVLTVKEVAELLQLNRRTIIRRFEDGTLPGKKIGSAWRCTRKSLDAYLETPNNSRAPSSDR